MMVFREYHIYPMYLGVKTRTRRFWNTRRHAKVGSTHIVKRWRYEKAELSPGTIYIKSITSQPLGMMTEDDAHDEGGYNLQMFKLVMEEIMQRPWDDLFVPFVVEFEFTPSPDFFRFEDRYLKAYQDHAEELVIRIGQKWN